MQEFFDEHPGNTSHSPRFSFIQRDNFLIGFLLLVATSAVGLGMLSFWMSSEPTKQIEGVGTDVNALSPTLSPMTESIVVDVEGAVVSPGIQHHEVEFGEKTSFKRCNCKGRRISP